MEEQGRVTIKVELSREDYRRLARIAEEAGYSLVSDFVRAIIADVISGRLQASCPEAGVDEKRLAEAIARRLERRIMDILNPFTGKIDEIQRRLGEILEALEARQAPREQAVQAPPSPPARRPQRERHPAPTSRGMARLREEGVVFESDLRGRLRQPDAFMRKLESQGAVIVEAAGERAAVDPEFWARLVEFLSRLSVRDEEEVAALVEANLGDRAARLFRLLVRGGLAFYDEESASWVVRQPRSYRGPTSS